MLIVIVSCRRASVTEGPPARQDPQHLDRARGVVEHEAHTPVADPQPPLGRIDVLEPLHVALLGLRQPPDGSTRPLGDLAV